MSKFERCPKNRLIKCEYWEQEKCEGCPFYTSYQIGRADALQEVLQNMKGETNGKKD